MARRRFQRGRIFERGKKNPVWIGRWREDELRDGTLVRIERSRILGPVADKKNKKQGLTKKLALRMLESILDPINSPNYRPLQDCSFSSFARKWMQLVMTTHRPSTQAAERSQIVNHLIPQFGNASLRDITGESLQRFVHSSQASPKTIRNCIYILSQMWRSARAWGYVTHDPFDGLALPQLPNHEQPHLTVQQVRLILDAAPEPAATFFWIAAETGMRASEICALHGRDVDTGACLIRVRHGSWRGQLQQKPKTKNATRDIPISPQLAFHLASLNLADDQPLFVRASGKLWDTNYVNKKKLQPLLGRLGLKVCGTHAFRHTNSTAMDARGVPLKDRQERLGHSDPRITLRNYTHPSSGGSKDFASAFGKELRPNAPTFERNSEEGQPQTTVVH